MNTYRLMLVLMENSYLEEWICFAGKLLPKKGEIHLRGLVTVEAEKSLSEGALPARSWRDTLYQVAQSHSSIHDEVQVYVNYQPLHHILEEVQQNSFDLLVIQWNVVDDKIGGMSIADILQKCRCNVVLVSHQAAACDSQNVLLSLRGGPNLSLGTQIAQKLAGDGTITLFHAVDNRQGAPDLEMVMRAVPQIKRTVSAVTGFVDGIVREASGHHVIVMGAGLSFAESSRSNKMTVLRQVYERTQLPLLLVRAVRPEAFEFHPPQFNVNVSESLSNCVDRWFAENTFHSEEFNDLQRLMALKEKQGVTISIALPALNEEETVGNVIGTLKKALQDDVPLVDEIVLIDSDSTDNTVNIAQNCGVPTFIHQQILAEEVGAYRGKGEALWKSLHVTKGDIVAWVDTDITNIHPRFIYGLLGPLLKHPRIQYVKGFYARPIMVDENFQAYGGGRVTELVARPLLNLFYPELSGIIQPLSGEYAGRRTALEQLPFFTGYGVETGLLIDMIERFGLNSIAQSDLEVRVHHNQSLVNLSKMSFAILQVFVARLESRYGVQLLDKANRSMKLVIHEPDRFGLGIEQIGDSERPPIISIPQYRSARGYTN